MKELFKYFTVLLTTSFYLAPIAPNWQELFLGPGKDNIAPLICEFVGCRKPLLCHKDSAHALTCIQGMAHHQHRVVYLAKDGPCTLAIKEKSEFQSQFEKILDKSLQKIEGIPLQLKPLPSIEYAIFVSTLRKIPDPKDQ